MLYLNRLMGKSTICIGENKGADQLRGNREADQRLCFRYSDSTFPLLLKYEISSFELFSVTVQVGLCRTWLETTLLVFPQGGSFLFYKFLFVESIFTGQAILRKSNEDGCLQFRASVCLGRDIRPGKTV